MKFLIDPERVKAGVVFYGVEHTLYGDINFYMETTVSPRIGDDPHIERVLLFSGHAGVDRRWIAWKIQGETLIPDEPYMEASHQKPRERLSASPLTLSDLVVNAIATMADAGSWLQLPAPQTIHRLLLQLQPLLI